MSSPGEYLPDALKARGRICFLDMDGVLADFVGGACAAHNRPSPYTCPEALGVFDIAPLWGMSAKEFWKPCNTEEFWEDLLPTSDASAIVTEVTEKFGVENIAILTAPSLSPYCVPGKRRWIGRYFRQFKDQIIFTSAKHFLAGPGRTLVDDRDSNVEGFRDAGGRAILVPRPWNTMHDMDGYAVSWLHQQLQSAHPLQGEW